MKLKLSEWAHVAEIIAAIGVIATLVFLVTSIRENTTAIRAESYDSLIRDVNGIILTVVENQELSHIWGTYQDAEAGVLTAGQNRRLLLLLRTLFRNYDKAYRAFTYETLGPEEFTRFEAASCRGYLRSNAIGMWEDIKVPLTEDFIMHVEASCQSGN